MAPADAVRRTLHLCPEVPFEGPVPQTAAAGDRSSGRRLWGSEDGGGELVVVGSPPTAPTDRPIMVLAIRRQDGR
jgi:hypothetical protein